MTPTKARPRPRHRTTNDPLFTVLARRFTLNGICRELLRHTINGTLHVVTNGNVLAPPTVGIDNARAFYDDAALKLSDRP